MSVLGQFGITNAIVTEVVNLKWDCPYSIPPVYEWSICCKALKDKFQEHCMFADSQLVKHLHRHFGARKPENVP